MYKQLYRTNERTENEHLFLRMYTLIIQFKNKNPKVCKRSKGKFLPHGQRYVWLSHTVPNKEGGCHLTQNRLKW